MKSLPKFNLRALFVITLCTSIGLTCGLPLSGAIRGGQVPLFNWHFALLSAASIAIAFGLFQQIGVIRAWRQTTTLPIHEFKFAVILAVSWRLIVGLLICLCLIVKLLIARGAFDLPEDHGLVTFDAFPSSLWLFCMVVALAEATQRRTEPPNGRSTARLVEVGSWIAGTIFALIVLPQNAIIHHLVHLATAGIEAYIPHSYQRLGTFPDHQKEGFRLFWLSVSAVVLVVIAAWSWFRFGGWRGHSRRMQCFRVATFVLPLVYCLAFSVWYSCHEFHRVSPDMAQAGVAGNWVDFVGAGAIVLIAISAAALQLSRDNMASTVITPIEAASCVQQSYFHESVFCISALLAASALYFLDFLQYVTSSWGGTGSGISFGDLVQYVITDTPGYLQLAVALLSIRLAMQKWRQRQTLVPWRLGAISPGTFIANWGGTALLVAIAIPTICSYCFTYWLGPWYRIGS